MAAEPQGCGPGLSTAPRQGQGGTIPRIVRIIALGAVVALAAGLIGWIVRPPVVPPDAGAFVRAEGRILVRNGSAFRLKSVGFSNYYTFDLGEGGFSLDRSRHHAEGDFERVRALGFNSVRFAINGNWYREDPRAFWRWLDRNVGWAEAHGVLLTLDLHVPIGGDWLDASDRGDFRIWTDPDIRAQNLELWRRIAERYRDVTAIGGYDILNEAVTADATGDQWRQLAGDIARTIREVDPNHLLVVGALYGTDRQFTAFGPGSQFLIDDPNVVYDFHFYEPVEFTHQTAGWLERPIADGGRYPDPDRLIPTGEQVLLAESSIESRRLPAGRSGWEKYESDWVTVVDPAAVAGLPTVTMRGGARGAVQFDDLAVVEYDPLARTTRAVLTAPLSDKDIWDWWSWAHDGFEPAPQTFTRSETGGANDDFSLRIEGSVGRDGYLGWSSDSQWIRVTPGNRYRISGYMTGEGVAYSETAQAPGFIGLTLDIYGDPAGREGGGFLARDREFLEFRFLDLFEFGRVHGVPMSVMEFGTIRNTFEVPDKGGAAWVADMLDIFEDHDVSFSLWNYHGPSMGLFLSDDGSAPSEPNQVLIDVLKAHLTRADG